MRRKLTRRYYAEGVRFVAALCACLLLVATLCGSPLHGATTNASYLLLVNTAIASQMDSAKFQQFAKSPYDGVAVAFQHAYDTSQVPEANQIAAKLTEWKKLTGKDIWPWVYLNRMIGKNAAETNEHADTPYFKKIAGADLNDTQGAQAAFLLMWKNSLAAARLSAVPGIVFDLEFYNNYKGYDIGELAKQTGKKPAEVVTALRGLGARMAGAASQEYPDAKLWFLATGLTHPGFKTYDGVAYYPSPAYIVLGMLDEIIAHEMRLTVLAGGEGSLGYCHESLAEFRSAIERRAAALQPVLARYKGTLELVGTMTLWSDRAAKKGWVDEGACRTATAATAEDLQPYLELLLSSYHYNWIYGSPDGNYLAFSADSAPRFDAVIRKARASAQH